MGEEQGPPPDEHDAVAALVPIVRREFFPEVDGGAFQMTVRAPTGTRIEVTENRIAAVEASLERFR